MDEKVSRPSPEASGITVRQLTDDQRPFHQSEPYYWYNGSIASTEYFHTYSVLFPEGENFFVRSVMAFMKHPGVVNNAKLQSEVRAFVSQVIPPMKSFFIWLFFLELYIIGCRFLGGSPCQHSYTVQQDRRVPLRPRYDWCQQVWSPRSFAAFIFVLFVRHAFTNFSIPTISFVKWLLSLPETYWTFSDTKTNCLAITCSLEHLTATLGKLDF